MELNPEALAIEVQRAVHASVEKTKSLSSDSSCATSLPKWQRTPCRSTVLACRFTPLRACCVLK